MDTIKCSRFFSFVLRHKPEQIGLMLDENGWANINDLIQKSPIELNLNRQAVDLVVAQDDKQRYKISDDGLRIRANQGHSVKINLDLIEQTPPDILYHGTATRFLDSILKDGLVSKQRNHVHLSADIDTAIDVGKRHGEVVVLDVDAELMSLNNHRFFLSENGVWLTDVVPPDFVRVISHK